MQGERITESELTNNFKCSRGPVREALVQLSKEGFISLTENKGAIVKKLSAQEVRDYYSLLEVIEGKAVEWATLRLKNSDIERLVVINNSLKQLNPDDENYLEEWCVRNSAFHEIFRKQCGNHKMPWITNEIRQRIFRYLFSSLLTSLKNEYIEDHENIIDAVRRKNPTEACKAMEKHISRAKDFLLRFLNQTNAY
jgi:DNA-binding GntR family transcriptional regulator